jgi:hypothetical protein
MPALQIPDLPEDLQELLALYLAIPAAVPAKFTTVEGQAFLRVYKPLFRSGKYKPRELANVLGVAQTTIYNWAGKRLTRSPRSIPKDEHLRDLRAALRVAAKRQRRRQDPLWGPVHAALMTLLGDGFDVRDIAHEIGCTPRWLSLYQQPPLVTSAEEMARAVVNSLPQQGQDAQHRSRQAT